MRPFTPDRVYFEPESLQYPVGEEIYERVKAMGCEILQTTLGAKPYIRVYVNMEDILDRTRGYIVERGTDITRFEAACTSDPLSTEHIIMVEW